MSSFAANRLWKPSRSGLGTPGTVFGVKKRVFMILRTVYLNLGFAANQNEPMEAIRCDGVVCGLLVENGRGPRTMGLFEKLAITISLATNISPKKHKKA